jgi:hypothetical protein
MNSIKGTELENVMKGKAGKFDPINALKGGYFAAQDENSLWYGMDFVKAVEADPKNVWANLAHEMGGHFEYGNAYASEIMQKALKLMPRATQDKWKKAPLSQKFFETYEYPETEIFAELRERRYTKPLQGKPPQNPTDLPDDDILNQLEKMKVHYHPEVAKMVLRVMKTRVYGSETILNRDKKFFVESVKKVFGYNP